MGRDGERKEEERGRDEEGWRGHGVVWSEGGRGSRAHSPELVVAHVLIIAHVLIVTHVLTITCVLVVACICSWALAVIRELRWPFWLVGGRMHCDSLVMVKGGWSSPLVGSGWWQVIVHGQWVVVVVVTYVLPWAQGIICGWWWLVVVILGWRGLFLGGGGCFCEHK